MIANYDYHCPHCNHKLNADNKIHFKVKDSQNNSARLMLSAIPGDFEFNPNLQFKMGETFLFFCESCNTNLVSKKHPLFIEINLQLDQYEKYRVLFSPTAGDKMTFVIMDNEVVKHRDNFFSIISDFNQAG